MIGILVRKQGKRTQMSFNLYTVVIISARYADDAGHRKFTEEAYELQSRVLAGGQWQAKTVGWTDLVRELIIRKN